MSRLLAVLLLAGAAPAALACGYCVEDKIASTYDHAVVVTALGKKHHVAFFHIDGPFAPGAGSKRALEAAAESVAGVDKGSIRVAVKTLTLSLAFDPRQTSLAAVQAALEKKLAAKKLSLMALRIMDSQGDLAAVRRR